MDKVSQYRQIIQDILNLWILADDILRSLIIVSGCPNLLHRKC
jgi:hypothetical protein